VLQMIYPILYGPWIIDFWSDWSVWCVSPLVYRETATYRGRLIAYIARIRFFACVCASMFHQMATYKERLVTYITCVRFFFSVHSFVCCQTATYKERLVEYFARVKFFACVCESLCFVKLLLWLKDLSHTHHII